MTRLPAAFYRRDTLVVARDLLGKEIRSRLAGAECGGIIVETEAYVGPDDLASHARGGRVTRRNAVMFEAGGFAYVYLIYGMHCCLNVVTSVRGEPGAVLIRAIEPTRGITALARNRGLEDPPRDARLLATGPGRLAQAMGVTRKADGAALWKGALTIHESDAGARLVRSGGIDATPRVNVDYSGAWAAKPWRFVVRGNRYVSRARYDCGSRKTAIQDRRESMSIGPVKCSKSAEDQLHSSRPKE